MRRLLVTRARRTGPERAKAPAAPSSVPAQRAQRQHLRRFMRAPAVQFKLEVGPADDAIEREADRIAEQVVRAPEGAPAAAEAALTVRSDPAPRVRRQADGQPSLDALEQTPPLAAEQQEVEVDAAEDVRVDDLGSADLGEIERGEPDEPAGEVRRKAAAEPVPASGALLDHALAQVARPPPGRALPQALRAFMEPRFDAEFARVRLHDTPADRRLAYRLGARAFACGEHIWLGPGERAEDRRLLAHELVHVLQQRRRGLRPAPRGPPAEPGEHPGAPRGPPAPSAAPLRVQRFPGAGRIEGYARRVPGYRLVTVILGRSPITGDRVERSATNFIGGVLDLVPGGDTIFRNLQESRAIERGLAWLNEQVERLDLRWSRVTDALDAVIDELPFFSLGPIRRHFGPIVRDVISFAGAVAGKLLEFAVQGALKLAGPFGERVWGVIQRAGAVIGLIVEDIGAFARNLFAAVLRGFNQFRSNVLDHLKRGLLGWLFGTLQGAGLRLPDRLDLRGLMSIALQVMGLSYDLFRRQLVRRLGQNGERKVGYLERAVEFVRLLREEGIEGAWRKLLDYIDNLQGQIVEGIRSWVITQVVINALGTLARLTNPIGGLIQLALSIYRVIAFFIERIEQIAAMVEAMFASIENIARGRLQQAGDYVEESMSRTVPVIISFLARLIGLSGIGETIKTIIRRIQSRVERAMERIVEFIVKKTKKLFARVMRRLNGRRQLPEAGFAMGTDQHRLFVEAPARGRARLMLESNPEPATQKVAAATTEAGSEKLSSDSKREAQGVVATVGEKVRDADRSTGRLVTSGPGGVAGQPLPRPQNDEAQRRIDAAAQAGEQAGRQLADNPDIDLTDEATLIRAIEPRLEQEGTVATYRENQGTIREATAARGTGQSLGTFYEIDHIPEKSLLQRLQSALQRNPLPAPGAVEPGPDVPQRAPDPQAAQAGRERPADRQAAPGFGQLLALAEQVQGDGPGLHTMIAYRPIHVEKSRETRSESAAREIESVLGGDDPPAGKERKVKEKVQAQVTREIEVHRRLYGADQGAAGDVRRRVSAGLERAVLANNTSFNLQTAPVTLSEAEIGQPSEIEGRRVLPFNEREGELGIYGTVRGFAGTDYEADHIVDKAYLIALRGVPILDMIDTSGLDLTDEERAGLAGRRAPDLFTTTSVIGRHSSDGSIERAGSAILMYRPIHRQVTGETVGRPREMYRRALAGDGEVVRHIKAWLRGEERPDDVRTAALRPIREVVGAQVDTHQLAIMRAYERDLAANFPVNLPAPSGASRPNPAHTRMREVVDRVRQNLVTIRNQNLSAWF